MPKVKISEYSSTANSNTDVASINIDEGCAPSGINNAIRAVMGHLKDFQTGAVSDPLTVGGVLTVTGGSAGTPAITTSGDTNTGIFFPAADTIAFSEGGTESARIDSGGNFGLGVTPAAWSGGYVGFQVKDAAFASFSSGYTWVGNNWYNNSGNKYIGTGNATLYEQNAGKHTWSTAASGTAGNAITFTQAMTLDASGNLGIGVTSVSSNISGSAKVLGICDPTNTNLASVRLGSGSTFASGARMEVYASSSQCGLYGQDAVPMTFTTNSVERARIDSSGNLLVGTTSTSYASTFQISTSNKFALSANNTAATTPRGYFSQFSGGGNDTSSYHFIGNTSSADKIVIYGNGNIQNTNNSYGALSDIKLKENITDATPKLADLMQVRIVNFNLKTEPEHKQIGVIAQELEQVFPALIEETLDRKDEEGAEATTTKSVKYSVFVPMLIKALQEQQALITSLTARITALEGN
jgi:hypothetical protein